MSALGQKQTFAPQNVMSALPPKADMCAATRDVRFGPIADITLDVYWNCNRPFVTTNTFESSLFVTTNTVRLQGNAYSLVVCN
jgi:hypothetical protein